MFQRQSIDKLWVIALSIAATLAVAGVYLLLSGHAPVGCLLLTCAAGLAIAARPLSRLSKNLRDLARTDQLVKNTDAILITTDRRGLIDSFNPAAERALGYGASEVIGKVAGSQMLANGGPSPQTNEEDRPDRPCKKETIFVRKDGTRFRALLTSGEIHDDSGELVGHFGLGLDIETQKCVEAELREKQDLIESIAASSPTIYYVFDLNERRITYSNRQLPSLLGYSDSQAERMGADPLPSLIHPEDIDILFNRYQSCRALRDGEVLEIEFRCLAASGELRWVFARDVVFKRDSDGAPCQILVNLLDITDQKMLNEQIENQVLEIHDTNLALEIQTNALAEANAQLESLAFTDGLTGIANHRSFQEELAKSFITYKGADHRLSLMLIDVDKFKQYNDTYGHPSGDVVLKWVASIIRDCSPQGCLPARYGGEEFAVLCPDFDAMDVLTLAEKVRRAIEETPWPERPVTVSIGAVTLSTRFELPSELVTAADTALYSSKASGRNCVTLYDYDNRTRLAG